MKKLLIIFPLLFLPAFPVVRMLSTASSGTNLFDQMLGQSTNFQTLVSNNVLFLWELSGSNTFYTNGNVGIGTNDPQKTFHVVGDSILSGNVDIEGNNLVGVGQLDVQTINAFGGTKITFSDDLDMGNKTATNFPEPAFSNAPATKFTVDSATNLLKFIDQDVKSGAAPTFNGSNISGLISGDVDATILNVKKASAGTIQKNKAVCVIGADALGISLIELADADDPSKMPAIGITRTTVDSNAAKIITVEGHHTGQDTTMWNEGDILYVSTVAGELTNIRPTSSSASVQNMAKVTFTNSSTGSIVVAGALRANDIPNLGDGLIFKGQGGTNAIVNLQSEISNHVQERIQLSSTNATSTTSTTFVLVTDMSNEPGAGTWRVSFSTSANGTSTSSNYILAIFTNGAIVDHSTRQVIISDTSQVNSMCTQAIVTIGAGEPIEIRYRNGTAGTFTVLQRNMIIE